MSANQVGVTLRAAILLAILAGCQTLAMLTGGIDLSVGAVASLAGFLTSSVAITMGRLRDRHRVDRGCRRGTDHRDRRGRLPRPPADHDARDEPRRVRAGERDPAVDREDELRRSPSRCAGSDRTRSAASCRSAPCVRAARATTIGLRRSGYGRLLYAVGDNPIATRLSGARAWQVLIVLYIVSALMVAIAGILISGLTNVASVTLADVRVALGRGGGHRRDVDHGRPR